MNFSLFQSPTRNSGSQRHLPNKMFGQGRYKRTIGGRSGRDKKMLFSLDKDRMGTEGDFDWAEIEPPLKGKNFDEQSLDEDEFNSGNKNKNFDELLQDDGIDFHPGRLEKIPEEGGGYAGGETFMTSDDIPNSGVKKEKESRTSRLQNRLKNKLDKRRE